jgi:photosystem II stability/assembly factor-like uncharacterized protein
MTAPDEQWTRCSRVFLFLGVLLALVCAGCAQATGGVRPPAALTPTPAATSTPSGPVSWHPATLPNQLAFQQVNGPDLAPAPSEATTAYACAAALTPGPTHTTVTPQVWVTHDAGAHWTQTAPVALDTGMAPDGQLLDYCALTVDAADARTVALQVNAPWTNAVHEFVTFDGGATWRPLAHAPGLAQLVSWQNRFYGTRTTSTQGGPPVFSVSRDQMQTWQDIDQGLAAVGLYVARYWLDPATGTILAGTIATTDTRAQYHLWETRDGGQHWTQLAMPTSDDVVAQAPTAGQPRRACRVVYSLVPNDPQLNRLFCSEDGGHTWATRPARNPVLTGSSGPYIPYLRLVAIAADGAVLATQDHTPTSLALYRLASGAAQWQLLGDVPLTSSAQPLDDTQVYLAYAAAPAPGALWLIPRAESALTSTGGYWWAAYPSGAGGA